MNKSFEMNRGALRIGEKHRWAFSVLVKVPFVGHLLLIPQRIEL